jgi:hypothetical protein
MAIRPSDMRYRLALAGALLDARDLDAAAALLADMPADAEAHAAGKEALERRLRDAVRLRDRDLGSELDRPRLAGRTEELERLLRQWREARDGHAATAVLRGRPGIGRTRLAEQLAGVVRAEGRRAVIVRATESERTLELGFIALLTRALLGLPGARGVTGASDAVLRSLLPSLGDSNGAGVLDEPSPTTYADALQDLLGAVGWEAPTLVVLEDLHWLDARSMAVLFRVLRHCRDEPLLFVLTASSVASDELNRALDDHCRLEHTCCIELQPLSPAAVLEVLSAFAPAGRGPTSGGEAASADARAPAGLPMLPDGTDLARRVHAATGGHPGRLAFLLRALADAGALVRSSVGWTLDAAAVPDPLPIPPPAPGEPARRVALLWRLGTAAAVLSLLALAAVMLRDADRAPPMYGGGEVWLGQQDSILRLVPPTSSGGDWAVGPADLPDFGPDGVALPQFTVSGARVLYLQRTSHGTPPYITVLDAAGEREVARGDTDINAPYLSPEGRRLAHVMDDPATDAYDIAVVIARPDGEDSRIVRRHPGRIGLFGWDSEGARLLLLRLGAPDSLVVIDPDGRPLHHVVSPRITTGTWCGAGRILFTSTSAADGRLRTWLWTPAAGEVRELAIRLLPAGLACSPDGTAALAFVADGRAVRLVLFDLGTGEVMQLLPAVRIGTLYWYSRPPPVIDRITIVPRVQRLRWGERTTLRATVTGTDGRLRDDSVEWRSTDPQVVSVGADGQVSANRPGIARIIATTGVWRADTLELEVMSEVSESDVVQRDALESLDTAAWRTFGEPSPYVLDTPEGRVLFLNGDGQNADGIISRVALDLSRGITAEVAFRLPITRIDRQDFSLALLRSDGSHDSIDLVDVYRARGYLSVAWPLDELERRDTASLSMNVGGVSFTGPVGAGFRPGEWNRLAIQVRADGEVSAWINGEHVVTSPLLADVSGLPDWRVALLGRSVDTQLWVRDLIVWLGLRY